MSLIDSYVAGFFDGEGSVLIYKRTTSLSPKSSTTPYQIRATLTNTNEAVIRFIQSYYGGNVVAYKPTANRKQGWKWTALCQDAKAFLTAIRPFLIVKGHEADLALAMQERIDSSKKNSHVKGRRGALPLPQEEIEARDNLWNQLQDMRRPSYIPSSN